MNLVRILAALFLLLKFIWKHPANRHGKIAAVVRFFRWQIRKRVWKKPIIVDVNGRRRFKIICDSKFSSLVYYNRLPDWDEMNFLLRFLREGDGFVDIGANVGFYSILASTVVKAADIHAIEANPSNFSVLADQFVLNGMKGVHLHPVAVSSSEGTVRFSAAERETGAISREPGGFSVPCRTMDNLLGAAFRAEIVVAKMDVEGAETEVLRGAPGLLARKTIPVWLFELSENNLKRGGSSCDELLAIFAQHGYRFYAWDEDSRKLVQATPHGKDIANWIACSSRELLEARLGVRLE